MPRTFIRQDAQIGSTLHTVIGFSDGASPGATMESGAGTLADDLNNLRSMLAYLGNLQTGNWYDPITAPSALDSGTARGLQQVQNDLHALERKRVLVTLFSLADITVSSGANLAVLSTGQLPSNVTVAVGAVTTRGTVAAAHGGTFGQHALSEVAGSTAISPKNLCMVVNGSTRDPIFSSGRRVYGLLQSENATDGHTATITTPNRLQVSFVRINAAGDDLESCPIADIENLIVNVSFTERKALDDLTEQDFLTGAEVDLPTGSTVDLQTAYDNQGTTPVDIATNITFDLEGPGLVWSIRDDLQAILLRVIEGSAGGTSEVELGADVDLFDVNALVNDFAAGMTVRSGGTRPIELGVTDGLIRSTAGDLRILGTGELYLDDGNQVGSTWAQTNGIKLSEDSTEWDAFETAFGGELSLLAAITAARNAATTATRTKVQATVTSDVTANTDVNGPGTHANLDVDLAGYNLVPNSFVDDVEVYLNGELLRNNAVAGAGDVYPGTTTANGDLRFTFALLGTGSKPDRITMIVNGQ